MTADEEKEQRRLERESQERQRKLDREFQQHEREKERRLTWVTALISGLVGSGVGLGSQLINKAESHDPTYSVQVSASEIASNLSTTILKVDPRSGQTWYVKRENDSSLVWVRIGDQPSSARK